METNIQPNNRQISLSFLSPPQLVSSRQDILESRIFQDFLKSGVLFLREINSLHLYKSRHKRTLLGGIMKGQSDDSEEAQVSHVIIT